jgi:DNA-binding response OmpR family regulator
MKKILIAINNDFLRETYCEVFKKEGFGVVAMYKKEEIEAKIKSEKFDIIIIDIAPPIDGFKIMEGLKKDGRKESVILVSQYYNKESRQKAIELDAKDFIAYSSVSPAEVIRKIKIVLGEQKSYRMEIADIGQAKELVEDLGYDSKLTCPKCGSKMMLNLTRDLSVGNHHFVVSFVCPNNCQ